MPASSKHGYRSHISCVTHKWRSGVEPWLDGAKCVLARLAQEEASGSLHVGKFRCVGRVGDWLLCWRREGFTLFSSSFWAV